VILTWTKRANVNSKETRDTMNDQPTNSLRHWRAETDADGITWLCIDKADGSANVLSSDVFNEFTTLIEPIERNPPRGLVIYSGKSNGFVMGADITEFTSIDSEQRAFEVVRLGQAVMDRIEALRCPTVAVINGFALGGGLELAMACDYRLAMPNKKPVIGLPEVQLGLHPGFGGTVRAVQIMGVRAAMQLMLTGQPISVEKASQQGLVDRLVTADNWKQASKETIASGNARSVAPLTERLLNLFFIRPLIARALRKQVAGKANKEHYPAPYAIIDLWLRTGGAVKSGYEAEARSFAKLMVSSASKNLVRVFFLQNRLKSQGKKPSTRIAKVHVVGAGVMGGDIAAWCALRGLEVTLQDRAAEYIEPAIIRAGKLFSRKVRDANDRAAVTDRLRADVEGHGIAQADLIIEAIYENLEAKQTLYKTLQESMKAEAILASNTSSIPLEELRTVLDAPKRFIGLHFFNPVAKMPLVEVIGCTDTEQEALDQGFAFVKMIGKFPLGCMSSPGFVVNRVLMPYMSEAMHIANEGITITTIDRAAKAFGMPMGPVELADTVGIDVALNVSQVLSEAFDQLVPEGLEKMIENNHLGRKTGQGFYRWEDGKALAPDDEEKESPEDLTDRLILPMLNESVACLHEGVVADADLLDAGVIFGTGFAPFRGGPLQYARDRGIDEIVARLNKLAVDHGDRFRPHAGWADL
jgi:3-hydroxyacyl-CoA dehydrogenase/enoyl-CoA hydratase/3-hydroxybutyryl-CoA epimerase